MKRIESMLTLTDAPWISSTVNTSTPALRKIPMPAFKADLLFLIAIPVVLLVGLVAANTIGVSALNAAHVELPPIVVAAEQPAPAASQPAATPDDTALWIALISSLVVNFLAALTAMFNTYMQVKLKIAMKDTQASIDENTDITKGIAKTK